MKGERAVEPDAGNRSNVSLTRDLGANQFAPTGPNNPVKWSQKGEFVKE